MNCPKCGSALPQGAAFCPVCNEPVSAYAAQPNAYVYPPVYPQQGYEQPAAQGYAGGQMMGGGAAQPVNGQLMGSAAQQPVAGQMTGAAQPVASPMMSNGAQPMAGQMMAGGAAQPSAGQPAGGAVQPMAGQIMTGGVPSMAGAAQPQGYAQQPVYQQSYAQYQQTSYPPGYQQPYLYGQQPTRDGSPLMTALSGLPHAFLDSFTKPAEVLRGLMERRDLITAPIVAGVVLLLSFLGGMVVLRSFISVIFSAISALTGVSFASTSASMNQGISYIAGRVAPAVGGIAVLCQLIAMAVMLAAFLVYVCAVCKVRFSVELALNFVAVTTLPTAAFALLAMLLSLLSPWLTVIVILCGMAVSEVQLCSLLSPVTSRPDAQLLPAKMLMVTLSLLLILLLAGLAGGALMGGVMRRILVLLSNVGSLI